MDLQHALASAPAPVNALLFAEIEAAVHTLERLAVEAAYAEQPCSQILLCTAELLRLVIPQK